MTRQLRIEYKNAVYHIMARGQRKENIFKSDEDREEFLLKLEIVKNKYDLKVHTYCLMDNHYHLLLETPNANLSLAMHHLNAGYSNYFRKKHDLNGSIFQGRFKGILVQKENYLILLSAYIHNNPVRAKIVEDMSKYKWSSAKNYLNLKSDNIVSINEILAVSGGHENYLYILKKHKNRLFDKEEIYGKNSLLGDEEFQAFAYSQIDDKKFKREAYKEITELHHLKQLKVEEILKKMQKIFKVEREEIVKKKRNNIFFKLYTYFLKNYTELTLSEIGEKFNMSYGAVSDMTLRFVKMKNENKEIGVMIAKLKEELKVRNAE